MAIPSASALVIGGGVVGRVCALALQRRGWQVTLLDPDVEGRAPSWGNAGHIATEQVEPLASLATLRSVPRRLHLFRGPVDFKQPLRHLPWIARYLRACAPSNFDDGRNALRALLEQSLPAWRRLVHAIDAPWLLREHGHWVCWESPSKAMRGKAAWQAADTGTAHCVELPTQRFDALQANLSSRLAGAVGFCGTAQIADPDRLAEQLALAFVQAGGGFHRMAVRGLLQDGGRVRALASDGNIIDADRIVVCAGIRSRELMRSLGLRVPLIAERGYHLQWRDHDWPDLPPVVFEDRSMILTRFSAGVRAAGFVEYADVDTPPDPCKWRRLRRHANELGLPVRGTPSQWFGARPTLPDYLPAMGHCRRFENLSYAFGHQHLGLTLAAISGELMADMSEGMSGAVDLAPFDLERFG